MTKIRVTIDNVFSVLKGRVNDKYCKILPGSGIIDKFGEVIFSVNLGDEVEVDSLLAPTDCDIAYIYDWIKFNDQEGQIIGFDGGSIIVRYVDSGAIKEKRISFFDFKFQGKVSSIKEIEKSLITRFRKTLWRPFLQAIDEYDLISSGDKICVCLSGGKDSALLAKLLQEYQLHGRIPFDLEFISLNPGYTQKVKERIFKNSLILGIPLTMVDGNLFEYISTQESPCYICARMRRGHLYAAAKALGCNKIVLGHHLNDVIETTLMGMFYSSEISFMRPKLRSLNFSGMELIRPLYKTKEKDIINWQKAFDLEFIACACPLTEDSDHDSKRKEIKEIVKTLKVNNPEIEDMVFRSLHNINTGTLIGTRNPRLTFNDIYAAEDKGEDDGTMEQE